MIGMQEVAVPGLMPNEWIVVFVLETATIAELHLNSHVPKKG